MNTNIYASPQTTLEHESDTVIPLTLKQILFSFQGRIGRKTFRLCLLVSTLITWVIIAGLAFITFALSGNADASLSLYLSIMYLLCIPTGWIGLALQAKRWHDRNKSAWWILIMLVPVIGPLWMLIEAGFMAGGPEANNYGPPSA